MAKEDVYQHNFRLNLNNPYHLKIHKQLMNVNKDVYKSKNDYMIRVLYDAIFGDAEEISENRLKEMEDRITKRVTQELLKTVLSMGSIRPVTTPISTTPMGAPIESKEETTERINEKVASAALGYFDDWSDTDDE